MLPHAARPVPNDAKVPCAGCTACCRHALVFIMPEHGDRHELYDTFDAFNPLTKEMGRAIRQKEDGDCIHLGPKGCAVYDRRPAICRAYDCRRFLLRIGDRSEQRRWVREGRLAKEIYEAGRARMGTLTAEERADP